MSSLQRRQRGNSRTNTVLNSMGESAEANPQSLRPGVGATERTVRSELVDTVHVRQKSIAAIV